MGHGQLGNMLGIFCFPKLGVSALFWAFAQGDSRCARLPSSWEYPVFFASRLVLFADNPYTLKLYRTPGLKASGERKTGQRGLSKTVTFSPERQGVSGR